MTPLGAVTWALWSIAASLLWIAAVVEITWTLCRIERWWRRRGPDA